MIAAKSRIYAIALIAIASTGFSLSLNAQEPQPIASPYTIQLARMLSKDLFELNGVPYLQPVVKVVNATSNSRFYHSAYVPSKVKRPYFRLSVNGMLGFVPENMKTFDPKIPADSISMQGAAKYAQIDFFTGKLNISDTAGLVHYIFLDILRRGLNDPTGKSIVLPPFAPTALGKSKQKLFLNNDSLKAIAAGTTVTTPFGNVNVYNLLPDHLKDSLNSVLKQFPGEFSLAEGGNINTVLAAVPQLEIGSLLGTELLLRYIPSIDMGSTIGDFSFWGVGLKHSLSQYFYDDFIDEDINQPVERPFDLAAQVVMQGTELKNTIGVTNASLGANATMFSASLIGSKKFGEYFEAYGGLAYESVEIKSRYRYYLPVDMQWSLGMLQRYETKPIPGDPYNQGDTQPQTTSINLNESSIKGVVGLSTTFYNVSIFLDYNISKFSIFTFGLAYKF